MATLASPDVPGCVLEAVTNECMCADSNKWVANNPEDGNCNCIHTAADWWTLDTGSCTCPPDSKYRESASGNCQCIAHTTDVAPADGTCTADEGYTLDTS